MKMIKGILFDLDGTLMYTLKDLHLAVNFALKNNGLAEIDINKTKSFIGSGIKNLILKAIDYDNIIFNKFSRRVSHIPNIITCTCI